MCLSDLQRATLGPYKWSNLTRKHAVLLKDLDNAPHLPVLASTPELWRHCYMGYIVPGGRFFVSLNAITNTGAALSLWDLGLPMQESRGSTPILVSRVDVNEASEPHWTNRWNMVVAAGGNGAVNIAISQERDGTM